MSLLPQTGINNAIFPSRKIVITRYLRDVSLSFPLAVMAWGVWWRKEKWGELGAAVIVSTTKNQRYKFQSFLFYFNYFWLHVEIGSCVLVKNFLQGKHIKVLKTTSYERRYFLRHCLSCPTGFFLFASGNLENMWKCHKLGTDFGSLTRKPCSAHETGCCYDTALTDDGQRPTPNNRRHELEVLHTRADSESAFYLTTCLSSVFSTPQVPVSSAHKDNDSAFSLDISWFSCT